MSIIDYIRDNQLTLLSKWPVKGQFVFAQILTKGDFPHSDQFEIYSNPEQNHFVSLNTTRGQFRVVRHEKICLTASEWQSNDPGPMPGLVTRLL